MYYELPTGVMVEVADRSDWGIYNEVFVCGEYDDAITDAVSSVIPGDTLRIVDLGANVGFFLLRTVHLLRKAGKLVPLEGIAVEGAPDTYDRLKSRVSPYPELSSVKLICGLVGAKCGSAFIEGGGSSAGASVGPRGSGRFEVTYVDLHPLAEKLGTIDLLKCDIEGSEETFTESYPALIASARRIAIEFHPSLCDSNRAKERILSAGFKLMSTKEGLNGAHTCYFKRD